MACDITTARAEPCKDSVGGINAVWIVNYGDIKGKAIFPHALIGFGDTLRNISTTEDVEKYADLANILYRAVTGNDTVDIRPMLKWLILDSDSEDLQAFLMKVVVKFPELKPELKDSLIRQQREKMLQAVVELAV